MAQQPPTFYDTLVTAEHEGNRAIVSAYGKAIKEHGNDPHKIEDLIAALKSRLYYWLERLDISIHTPHFPTIRHRVTTYENLLKEAETYARTTFTNEYFANKREKEGE